MKYKVLYVCKVILCAFIDDRPDYDLRDANFIICITDKYIDRVEQPEYIILILLSFHGRSTRLSRRKEWYQLNLIKDEKEK